MEREEIEQLIEDRQYNELRRVLIDLNEADIASIMEDAPKEERLRIFRLLKKDKAADVFSFLSTDIGQELITALTDVEAANVINNLMADDAADLMEEMPANVVKRLLAHATAETRRDINHLLKFPDDSAGSIMTVEYVDLKANWTISKCMDRIRSIGLDSETIYTCYVIDDKRKLIGTAALRYLIIGDPNETVGSIMNENVIAVHTLDDQEEVAKQFQKYDFNSMPVVDKEDRLVGIITVDDIMDIIQEETTEDIEKMAAIMPTDQQKPYLRTSVFELWKKRIIWLLFLMVSATFTGTIITHYEDALGAYIVLTAFIPMIMDTSGNAGSQTSVTIIRALSLDEIEFSDFFSVVWKEMRVAMLAGITLAAANFVKLQIVDRVSMTVALVVCLTLVATVFVAKLIGAMLPMISKKIGLDPAVMASPFITTIVDAVALLVYFTFATTILGL
ncbi:MAG: magnesium transporter [Lachnospiraceae bacterium]|nr:magnesium transporter [Lachnospiraceae bacterium]